LVLFGFGPSEFSLANESLDGIFQLDAFFGHMAMSSVVPAPLGFVLLGLGRDLFGEFDISFPELCIIALGQDMLAGGVKGMVN
jgi:hypothetical protein